jgi:hypothetical protein
LTLRIVVLTEMPVPETAIPGERVLIAAPTEVTLFDPVVKVPVTAGRLITLVPEAVAFEESVTETAPVTAELMEVPPARPAGAVTVFPIQPLIALAI